LTARPSSTPGVPPRVPSSTPRAPLGTCVRSASASANPLPHNARAPSSTPVSTPVTVSTPRSTSVSANPLPHDAQALLPELVSYRSSFLSRGVLKGCSARRGTQRVLLPGPRSGVLKADLGLGRRAWAVATVLALAAAAGCRFAPVMLACEGRRLQHEALTHTDTQTHICRYTSINMCLAIYIYIHTHIYIHACIYI
jgi:hypothetical protein